MCSGGPKSTRPPSISDLSERRTSSRCSSPARAPIRTSGFVGFPTVTRSSRPITASATASRCSPGTNARRMAVHFWPALTVISVTSCFT